MPMTRSLLVKVAAAALFVAAMLPQSARAQEPDKAAKAARAHFERAEASFNMGDFDKALAAYQAAYKAKPLPGFLFNVAQCHRNLGNHERALFFYRRYLALDPATPNRQLVEDLIVEEEKRQSGKPKAAEAPAAVAPPPISVAPPPAAAAPPPITLAPPPAPAPPPAKAPAVTAPPPAMAPPPPAPLPTAAAAEPSDEPPLFVKAAAARSEAEPSPVYKRWWFWAGVGTVVAAGVVTAVMLSGDQKSAVPSGSLKMIDWR
jgi:tetratricopeptide (TPR) repeat protein